MYQKYTHWNLLFTVDLLYYIFVHMYLYYVRARKFLVCIIFNHLCTDVCTEGTHVLHVRCTCVPHIYIL